MHNKKETFLPTTTVKSCLSPEEALAVAKPFLKNLGEVNRSLLSAFEAEIKAYEYRKVFIWVISVSPQPQASNQRLTLYVEVKTSVVKAEVINLQGLKALEERKMMKIGSSSFWYIQGCFSPLKYGNIMTRAQCEMLWNKVQPMHKSRLEADSYVVFERPVPAIDRQTPLYIIAFRQIPYNVEALVVFPNLGKVTTHVYHKSIWRKMLRKKGMGIVKGNTEIIIAPDGFVTTMKMH